MMEKQVFKGKYANSRPTEAQIALLQKMGVRESVIQTLTRQSAYELIHSNVIRFYEEQTRRRFNGRIVVRW